MYVSPSISVAAFIMSSFNVIVVIDTPSQTLERQIEDRQDDVYRDENILIKSAKDPIKLHSGVFLTAEELNLIDMSGTL